MLSIFIEILFGKMLIFPQLPLYVSLIITQIIFNLFY